MNFGVTQTQQAGPLIYIASQYFKKDCFRFEGDTKKGSFRQTSYAAYGCFSVKNTYGKVK